MGTSTPLAVLVGLPTVGMSEQLEALKLSAPLSFAGVRVHAGVGPLLIQTLLFLPAGKPRVTTHRLVMLRSSPGTPLNLLKPESPGPGWPLGSWRWSGCDFCTDSVTSRLDGSGLILPFKLLFPYYKVETMVPPSQGSYKGLSGLVRPCP